jgi:hypothetical protein
MNKDIESRKETKEEMKEKVSGGIKALRSGNVTAVKVSRQCGKGRLKTRYSTGKWRVKLRKLHCRGLSMSGG